MHTVILMHRWMGNFHVLNMDINIPTTGEFIEVCSHSYTAIIFKLLSAVS